MTPLSETEAAIMARFEAAEPAPESWSGLREAVFFAVREAVETSDDLSAQTFRKAADAVLALPEVAVLRAKAAAADRVRELHTPLDRGTGPRCQGCSTHVTFTPWPCATIRALDGADRTDRGRC